MKKIIYFILIFLVNLTSLSQNLEVIVNKNPALNNEVIQLEFSINGKGSNFIPPPLSNFHVISGPSSGIQQSYSNINGKVTQNINTTISYKIQAKKAGKFTIGSASILINGERITSDPLSITINQNNKEANINNNEKHIFIKQTTNKSEIYVGEQIYAITKLYIKEGLQAKGLSITPIMYNNFWVDKVELNPNERKSEIIDGVRFTVVTLRHDILTPQKSGDLFIPKSEIELSISKKGELIGYDFFGYPKYETILTSKNLLGKEKEIKVKELPQPIPEDFYEIVSKEFKINSEIDRSSLKTGEAINFKLLFRGNGNINMLEPLNMRFPESFEVFEPNITNKTFTGNYTTSGTKTFEYILIPRQVGEFKIPAIKFNYFNPDTKKYIEIQSEEYIITVDRGEKYVETTTKSYAKENLNLLSDTSFTEINKRDLLFKRYQYVAWFAFILIFLMYPIKRYLKNRKIDPIAIKKRKATKIAIQKLKNANLCIKNNDFDQFFEEIEKALWGYFANKFNVNQSQLSKETIEDYFNINNITQENKLNFINILKLCEFSRFSPSKDKNQQMEETLNKAKEIIINVESSSKK